METHEAQHAGKHDALNAPARCPTNDGDTYRMMVLRFDRPEEDVDDQLVQTALDLGIDVSRPPSPDLSIADVIEDAPTTENVSAPSDPVVIPQPSVTPEPSIQSSSQTSGSSKAQSDSSIDYKRHTKTPSVAATSITSVPSIDSASSQISNRARVKKGIRRLSALRRRKPSTSTTPPALTPTNNIRPASRLQGTVITAEALSTPNLQPHALTTDEPVTTTSRSRQLSSASSSTSASDTPLKTLPIQADTSPTQPKLNPLSGEEKLQEFDVDPPPSPSTLEAQHRSLHHPVLKKLRTAQLQEQLRFISFQASQTRLMRTAHLQAKRAALSAYKAHQIHLETIHADSLVSFEQRHLTAEEDLRKGLEAERKNCDVKLKHMQAYCNPRNNVEGMPRREVTKADHRKLEQQYHIRNNMDNLHTSRINVLREKQGKQLERIMAKQQAELEKAEADFEQENIDLDQQFRDDGESLRKEFLQRRKRLVTRWRLMEKIERRKLEIETGEEFGEMPEIVWAGEDERKGSIGSAWSVGEANEEVDANNMKGLDAAKMPNTDAVDITDT